jgi:predicted TIM-barrel fold metal-dependent hydrolase
VQSSPRSDVTGGDSRVVPSLIDCDVHPVVHGGIKALFPYMTESWRRRFEAKLTEVALTPLTVRFAPPNGSVIRADAATPEGGAGGSNPQFMKEDLLDRHGIDYALLNCLQPGALAAALAGPEESVMLCRAFNDFFLDRWVSEDKRFKYVMSASSQSPEDAATEIRRLGSDDGVVAVSLPLLNTLMGTRHYYPIYEAAEEKELPIFVHVIGTDYVYQGAPQPVGGVQTSYAERFCCLPQIAQANLSSLVFSGILERFPKLTVVFVEYGFAWTLPLLWRMDKTWRSLRHETPWVKKSPIEYVHERVRLTTQPLDEPQEKEDLESFVGMLGDDLLLFSTDYPHWDNDMPASSFRGFPAESRRRIFAGNAMAAIPKLGG